MVPAEYNPAGAERFSDNPRMAELLSGFLWYRDWDAIVEGAGEIEPPSEEEMAVLFEAATEAYFDMLVEADGDQLPINTPASGTPQDNALSAAAERYAEMVSEEA